MMSICYQKLMKNVIKNLYLPDAENFKQNSRIYDVLLMPHIQMLNLWDYFVMSRHDYIVIISEIQYPLFQVWCALTNINWPENTSKPHHFIL